LGSGEPEEGPRCAARVGHDPPRYKAHVRPQGSGRSGTTPDWNRDGVWRQSRERRALSQRPSSKNDGKTVHRLTINSEVPVDGFWSIIVYNDKGYLERNPYNAYSLNSITAKKGADGSIIIQFGGCDGKIANCLPTMPGWNYMVRLYRPRAEILNGTWKFPEAQSVN
jgi:hypothetical protein